MNEWRRGCGSICLVIPALLARRRTVRTAASQEASTVVAEEDPPVEVLAAIRRHPKRHEPPGWYIGLDNAEPTAPAGHEADRIPESIPECRRHRAIRPVIRRTKPLTAKGSADSSRLSRQLWMDF
jgi:hypothetical protein